MKTFIFIIFVLLEFKGLSQVENKEEKVELIDPKVNDSTRSSIHNNYIYDLVDETADFPGGMYACKNFILSNLVYPQNAKENKLEGKCFLKFIVSETGNISNIKVLKGVPNCPECDVEALRIVQTMPKWKPAKINGKPVNSTFTLPVQFKLS
jgi:periplasmic protein TonB